MIGGVRYFAHVGMGPSAFLQLGLIVGSFLIAWMCMYGSNTVRPLATIVAIGALLFALSFVSYFFPILIAVPLSYFSPRVFPYSTLGGLLPGLITVLAIATRAEYQPPKSDLAT